GVQRVEPPGTWRSVCWCHGSGGNAEFLLTAFRAFGKPDFLSPAQHMIEDCIAHGIEDGDGLKWEQNDGRYDSEQQKWVPEWFAHTGFSQGSAGIIYALLHFD